MSRGARTNSLLATIFVHSCKRKLDYCLKSLPLAIMSMNKVRGRTWSVKETMATRSLTCMLAMIVFTACLTISSTCAELSKHFDESYSMGRTVRPNDSFLPSVSLRAASAAMEPEMSITHTTSLGFLAAPQIISNELATQISTFGWLERDKGVVTVGFSVDFEQNSSCVTSDVN